MLSTYVVVLFVLIISMFGWSLGQLLEQEWIKSAILHQELQEQHRECLDWYFWHEDEWFWEEAEIEEVIQVKQVGAVTIEKAWHSAFFGWLPGTTYEEEMGNIEEEFYTDFMMGVQIDEALL